MTIFDRRDVNHDETHLSFIYFYLEARHLHAKHTLIYSSSERKESIIRTKCNMMYEIRTKYNMMHEIRTKYRVTKKQSGKNNHHAYRIHFTACVTLYTGPSCVLTERKKKNKKSFSLAFCPYIWSSTGKNEMRSTFFFVLTEHKLKISGIQSLSINLYSIAVP